jgi:coproporphyrinogen III oxidase-like Fe-S oxidoreductase
VETTAAGEPIGEREMINERIFLGLRADGVDVRRLSRDFGVDLAELHRDVLDRLEQDARLTRTGDLLRLTPRGYLLCDEIAEYLMLA